MSIEFPCFECGKLLRVGDDAAGKQARCPACGAVMSVPSSTETASNPFGGAPLAPRDYEAHEANPYQAPAQLPSGRLAADQAGAEDPIRPTRISVAEVFESTWTICRENFGQLGMCLAAMILCVVINIGVRLAFQVVIGIVSLANPPPIVAISMHLVFGIASFFFQIWIGIGQTIFFLKSARGQETPFSLLFSGGPHILPMLLAAILLGLMFLGAVLICAAAAAGVYLATREPIAGIGTGIVLYFVVLFYFTLAYYQFYFLIPDQGLGGLEALRVSRQITRGNLLALLGVYLGTLGLMLCSVLLCCLPLVLAVPFTALAYTIAYLKMAGQPTADAWLLEPATASPFAPPPDELR